MDCQTSGHSQSLQSYERQLESLQGGPGSVSKADVYLPQGLLEVQSQVPEVRPREGNHDQ